MNGVQLPFALPWLATQLSGLVAMAAAKEAARARARGLLMDGVVMIAAAIAAIAIYEAAGGALWWDAPRRPGATFGNRNAVGGFCAIALPVAVARMWEHRPRVARGTTCGTTYGTTRGATRGTVHEMTRGLWRTVALAMLALAVLLCRARSSWLALLLVSAAMAGLAIARRSDDRSQRDVVEVARRRRALLAIAAAVVAAFLAMSLVPWRLAWREDSPMAASLSRLLDYETGTGKSRVEQHQVGMSMVAEQPLFGFGPGTWRREAPRFAHAATGQHAAFIAPLWTPASDLLRHVVETGLVGAATALAMVALLFRGGWRAVRRGAGAARAARAPRAPTEATLALMASFSVALIISCFDALLARPASLVLVATIAGLLRAEEPVRDDACDAYDARAASGSSSRTLQVAGWLCGAAMISAAAFALLVFAPRYRAAQRFADDFSPRSMLANHGASFLPYESAQVMSSFGRSSNCEATVRAARLALHYLPNEPRILQRLARCVAKRSGDAAKREASELWRRSLEIEPHDEEALRALQALQVPPHGL